VIKAVKGTRDLLPPATAVWNHVESVAREVFRVYNYHEIRTPIFEETLLFARGVGEDTDIVTKEMYTFDDRDGSSLTLRPENTASVIRAYIDIGSTRFRESRNTSTSARCFDANARRRAASGSSTRSARKRSAPNRRWSTPK
jgi:histidyl-tRNA synthetase